MAIIVDRLNTAILSALGGPVVIFRGTLGGGGSGGVTDHGALTGLTDDDHPQYALADGSRGAFEPAGIVAALASTLGEAATADFGTGAGDACEGNDARLSDARTPTAHDQGSDTITTTIKTVSTTTYTFLAEDDGKYIVFTNAAGCAATIPGTLTAGWSVGCEQEGAGQVAFGISGSMVLGNRQGHTKTAGVRAMVSLVVKATNKVTLGGDTGT